MALLRPVAAACLALSLLLPGCLALQEKPAPVAATTIPVEQAQAGLYALGYRPGPVDGIFGPRTRDAVVRFRAAEGLPAGDMLDAEFAQRMAERLAFEGYERRRSAVARASTRSAAAAKAADAGQSAERQVDTDLRAFLDDWEERAAGTGPTATE